MNPRQRNEVLPESELHHRNDVLQAANLPKRRNDVLSAKS